MKNVVIIPSRMASTRLPGKPLIEIDGIPMIQRVWQQAINSNIGEVFVACAEKNIYDLITNLGGNAILTDPDLPSGTDRIYAALKQTNTLYNYDYIINLQGDMPLIQSEQIKKVIEPLKNKFSIGTLATSLNNNELNNPNVTKVNVEWNNKIIGKANEFFRFKNNIIKNTYQHVGIYSYTLKSLTDFVNLPKSKNEILLNLEQYRAMDAKIDIGVCYEKNIPLSIDTKEDLITAETIIRENNEKN